MNSTTFFQRYPEVLSMRSFQKNSNFARAIQNKRRGMLTAGVSLLHDNARPHVAASTTALLNQFSWDVLTHPPYSPDLAPSDYHLFTKLKESLAGKRFQSDEEVQTAVTNWTKELALSSIIHVNFRFFQ
ncbi:SETMR methyltransferase, partial [Acromyrmex heyeri]